MINALFDSTINGSWNRYMKASKEFKTKNKSKKRT